MSVKCSRCGFDSPDGASWCDFCKEPFAKKPKASAPAAVPEPAPARLAGLTKEGVETLAVDQLLKPEEPPIAAPPGWLRPLAWIMLAATIVLGTISLFVLQRHYEGLLHHAPPAPAQGPVIH